MATRFAYLGSYQDDLSCCGTTAAKQGCRQDSIPKLSNRDINETMRGTWNGSASDWPKAQGVKEKIGLYRCYHPLSL